MRIATATVVSGKVVVVDTSIADGTADPVFTETDDDAVRLSPDELAELEAGVAEADRGELIPGEALLTSLHRHG